MQPELIDHKNGVKLDHFISQLASILLSISNCPFFLDLTLTFNFQFLIFNYNNRISLLLTLSVLSENSILFASSFPKKRNEIG